jgi:hypothetical protein
VSGVSLNISQNFQLREDNIISIDNSFRGFYGGFNYFFPMLSRKLNGVSPNLNGARFHFYLSASAGVDQIAAKQHYSFLAGGGAYYDLDQSGKWTLGAEVRYIKAPGYANNSAIVSVGPAFHF